MPLPRRLVVRGLCRSHVPAGPRGGKCSALLQCSARTDGRRAESLSARTTARKAGLCHEGMCHCDVGRYGEDCSRGSAQTRALATGSAWLTAARVPDGWRRFDCSERQCPKGCGGPLRSSGLAPANARALLASPPSRRAVAASMAPASAERGGGADCRRWFALARMVSCSGHGRATTRRACACRSGWTGVACEQIACSLSRCLNGGQCVDNRCYAHTASLATTAASGSAPTLAPARACATSGAYASA